jgi:hypothetical protein
MSLLMMTQYFDALRDIGQVSNTILMPHSSSIVQDLGTQLRMSITTGVPAAQKSQEAAPGNAKQ